MTIEKSNKLKNTILKKLIQILITLMGISLITYSLIYLAPGDPIRTMYISSGFIPSDEIIEQTRELMGLNEPFIIQYLTWVSNILKGDLGMSYSLSQPVLDAILPRIVNSLYLALTSLILMIIISIPLGIISSIKKDSIIDYIIRIYTFVGISCPNFFVGTLLLYFFASKLRLLPVVAIDNSFESLILPSITLAIAMSSKYTRQIRVIMLEELSKEYVLGAKARGFSQMHIIFKEIIPNILPPIVTLLALSFGSLLSGVAVIEVIFSYPGIGSLAVNAISSYDYPLIQAYVLLISLIYMIVNFMVDVSYHHLDPRMKVGFNK